MATFYWNGYKHNFDAQTFGETVQKLEEEGPITPPAVVEAARPVTSPIHGAFEWDDLKAGESWRRHQARNYLAAIRVQVTEDSEPERVYYHAKTKSNGDRYVTKAEIMSDEELKAEVLLEALTLLRAARERYRDVAELCGVWEALDALSLVA